MKKSFYLFTGFLMIGALLLGVPETQSESPRSIQVDFPFFDTQFTQGQVDTFYLARYSFDDFGFCTPQGWLGVDRTSEYGDFTGLFHGVATLQEDPCAVDFTCVWGFFNNSSFDYACGGFPQQLAVPYQNQQGFCLSNEIRSPEIPLDGSGSNFLLSFRVYRDLPLENLVFYTWRVRSFFGEFPSEWRSTNTYHYGGEKDWKHVEVPLGSLIEPGATAVQIALGCFDLCNIWCGTLGDGSCHSHAPLFDDVSFRRIDDRRPEWIVRYIDLFQDNFASDGTVTGTVRADAALDILPRINPEIRPGDSVCVTVSAFETGLDYHVSADPQSGPAVYCHVMNLNMEKSGDAISGDQNRWPLAAVDNNWTVLRLDTAFTQDGSPAFNRFCLDLNDNLYTPGDTVRYFFSARDASGRTSYWSRTENGQGSGFTTTDVMEAISSPLEFTCLPAACQMLGDILYIDDADDETLTPQVWFDQVFYMLGIRNEVDRFDVLGASSLAGNGPGSRIIDILEQVIPFYRIIIWNSGSLASGLIGDGGHGPEKSPDAQFLTTFLDQHPDNPGIYISGDHITEEWNKLGGGPVQNLKDYMEHTLLNGSHIAAGVPISPLVIGQSGSIFDHVITSIDTIVAYGGCPTIGRFDVLQPEGTAKIEMTYSDNLTHAAVLSQSTQNSKNMEVRSILSGFSFHNIRDDKPRPIPDRADHLRDILLWLKDRYVCPGDCHIRELSAKAVGLKIELNWDLGNCRGIAEEVRIYRDNDLRLATLPPTQTLFVDKTVTPGEAYTYILGVLVPPSGGGTCPVKPRRELRFSFDGVRANPAVNQLGQNFPNPFKPVTTIEYSIEKDGHVSIQIYDVMGHLVRTLVNEKKKAKLHIVEWDGKNDGGDPVASGVYLYRIATPMFEQTKKMVLLR